MVEFDDGGVCHLLRIGDSLSLVGMQPRFLAVVISSDVGPGDSPQPLRAKETPPGNPGLAARDSGARPRSRWAGGFASGSVLTSRLAESTTGF